MVGLAAQVDSQVGLAAGIQSPADAGLMEVRHGDVPVVGVVGSVVGIVEDVFARFPDGKFTFRSSQVVKDGARDFG